jgi:hypothetical protein
MQKWGYIRIERRNGAMRAGALVAIVAGPLLGVPAQAAPSRCKGLPEQTCRADKACAWMPERKAGETKAKTGELHKLSAKAHCRLNTRKTS